MMATETAAADTRSTGIADWRNANTEWLALALEQLRLRLGRRARWLERLPRGQRWAADWLLSRQDATQEAEFYARDEASLALERGISALDTELQRIEEGMRATSRPPALRGLAEIADLSPFEEDILLLVAAPSLDGAFGRMYAELQDDDRRAYPSLQLALSVFIADVPGRILAADCLTAAQALRRLRFVCADEESGGTLLTCPLRVDDRIADYARGLNSLDHRLKPFLAGLPATTSTNRTQQAAERAAATIAGEPNRWTTVNLLGLAEAGASDVATAACDALGLALHTLDVKRLAEYSPADRVLLIDLLGREALLGGLALLIDTAGIDRNSPESSAVDEVIARAAATIFVVSAERWRGAHELRLEPVDRPTRSEQQDLWRAALGPVAQQLEQEISAIVQQFDLGPRAIGEAVAQARQHGGGVCTGQDLWRACREQSGAALDELARRITPCHNWNNIVVADNVLAQLHELASQVEGRSRVYESWGFGARLSQGRGISALFAGPSGTGKTMAAEIIAAQLELDLHRIDLSGVVSKYIGETEKNLRRVFDAAERSGAILFFDEADSLYSARTETHSSNDRHANGEVNYLLQRMEDYTGLAILATNRRSALDTAFLRRLRFVIEFPFPSVEQRRRIWEGIFPPQAELDGVDCSFLSQLELAGGNIRSVAINAAFLAAAERSPIGMPQVMRAAAREYAKLSRPVSAQEFGEYYAVVRA
jgi:hypothetical protein